MGHRAAIVVVAIVFTGCERVRLSKDTILGTWEREYEGAVVQEITFRPDGGYETDNPRDPGRPELGKYEVAPDGQTMDFTSRRGVKYTWHVRLQGSNRFNCWEELDGRKRFDFIFTRKK